MLSDQFLRSCHNQGFLAGPKEDETMFLKRVALLKDFSKSFIPLEGEAISLEERSEISADLQKFFACKADWIPIFYSNKNLPFWQGAATWLDLSSDALTPIPLIQLKEGFQKGGYLGLYNKDEVLLHEIVHAIRMSFEENRFEEILAYQTSKSFFRRFFGPVFRTSRESYILVFSFIFSFLLQCLQAFFGAFYFLILLSFFPYALLGYYFCRLCFTQYVFFKCLRKMKCLLSEEKAFHFVYCLMDEEIAFFSKERPSKILLYIREQTSLRWKQLREVYSLND